LTSVQDKIKTSISKVTDRLKGDTTGGSEGTNAAGPAPARPASEAR
jgi:hypothetical protein